MKKLRDESVVVISGDGSYHGAMRLTELGFPAIVFWYDRQRYRRVGYNWF